MMQKGRIQIRFAHRPQDSSPEENRERMLELGSKSARSLSGSLSRSSDITLLDLGLMKGFSGVPGGHASV